MPSRLLDSLSPYLLQHAGNPVDWFPWGDEAIALARRDDRPLFVSIGYATCYWCHVMERESFEDHETAAVLNRLFVPVKVDRELRPDIDDVYMTACQVFTRLTEGRSSGGWPLSVFVEPHRLRPFYVGTYFPPQPAYGRPSFVQVLESLGAAWRQRRGEIDAQAERLAAIIEKERAPRGTSRATLDATVVDQGVAALRSFEDRTHGGFGGAPKFPQPSYLELLERRIAEPGVAKHLTRTLDAMAIGGIFDQIGGGFHRYAVDETWTVPHFEKMLYDNAQLAPLYARSFHRSGDRFHAEIARRTCEWALREMRGAEGGFYSAIDAEVAAREGQNYVWTPREVEEALREAGRDELNPFAQHLFALRAAPNFRDPHHPLAPAAHVLRLAARPEEIAVELGLSHHDFEQQRSAVHQALLAARAARQQPRTDDKVLTSWNGLMIAALAECSVLLGDPPLLEEADRALKTLDQRVTRPDGSLVRATRGSVVTAPAFLEDYACLIRAHVQVALAGRNATEHHARAHALALAAEVRFAAPDGGWFDAEEESNAVLFRGRSLHDGAVPCAHSLMLMGLLDLLRLADDATIRGMIQRAFAALSSSLVEETVGLSLAAVALDRALVEAPARVLPLAISDEATPSLLVVPEAITTTRTSGEQVAHGTLVLTLPHEQHVRVDEGTDLAVFIVTEGVPMSDPRLHVQRPPGRVWLDGSHVASGTVHLAFQLDRCNEDAVTFEVVFAPCDERMCYPEQRLRATARIQRP